MQCKLLLLTVLSGDCLPIPNAYLTNPVHPAAVLASASPVPAAVEEMVAREAKAEAEADPICRLGCWYVHKPSYSIQHSLNVSPPDKIATFFVLACLFRSFGG
jgi:hypothetical protein